MSIKRKYYYLFYKLYKFGEASPSTFSSDFTAGAVICILEISILASLLFYATPFLGRGNLKFISFPVLTPLVLIFVVNYFAFIHNTVWKKYVKEFDRLPPKKNAEGTWIVVGVIVLIIVNLAFSGHIMSQIPISH